MKTVAFCRTKKIKGKEYAYIVENIWKHKSSRQKVKDYLGRAYRFELKNDVDFQQFVKTDDIKNYIESSDNSKILNDLIGWELFKFNIDKNKFSINLSNKKIQKNGKNVALLINEGFLCGITLKNLLEFEISDEHTDTYKFARAFVEAGIKVPHEVFVGLFGKLYKPIEKQKSDFTW